MSISRTNFGNLSENINATYSSLANINKSERTDTSNAPPKPPRILESQINDKASYSLSEDTEGDTFCTTNKFQELKGYKQRICSPLKLLNKKTTTPSLTVTEIVDRRVSRDPLGDVVILNESSKHELVALQELVNYETTVIQQTMKALHECKNTVNCRTSKSLVECQMLLLISSKRRTQLIIKMQRLRSGMKTINNNCNMNMGKLIISNIKLPLKTLSSASIPAIENVDSHYFILMFHWENEVKFSSLRSNEDQSITGWIEFNDQIEFNNATERAYIDVEIYSTSIPTDEENNTKSKSPHKMFMGPKKIFSKKLKMEHNKCFSLTSNVNNVGQIRTFSLVANTKIQIQKQRKVKSYFERVVSCNSILSDCIVYDVLFEGDVKLHNAGFLTMFEMVDGFGAWHRRWFQLSGPNLKYWNYPTDVNNKTELGNINMYLCSSEINQVSRDLCARPNTFEIQWKDEKLLLSADSLDERIQWCQILNQQLSLINKS